MAALVEAARLLAASDPGGHADHYLPVQGDIFDGELGLGPLVVSTLLVVSLGALAAGAGIGGGGLFVPIYAFVLGVGAKAAVPLSKATILGGAIGNMLSIAFARHPDPEKNRPLIDYEASTFMQSGELLGVVFGVLLNMVLPDVLIIAFLACLLAFNAYKTLRKGISKYREETRKRKAQRTSSESPPKPQVAEGTCVPTPPRSYEAADNTKPVVVVAPPSSKLQEVLAEDAVQFPKWAWAMTLCMTLYTVAYAWVKKTFLSTCEPIEYWLWYFSPVPVLCGCMYLTALILKSRHRRRVEAGYHFMGDGEECPEYRDLKWTDETMRQYPLIALLAGVSAGLLGIGGGMVIGPLFIHLDMQPKVGSSSCAYMILWTAASGVIQYMFAGKLGIQFVLFGVAVGFVSGQLGQRAVDHVLQKSGRPSYVIFLLGGIVAVACVAMTTSGIFKLAEGFMEGEDMFEFDIDDFMCRG